MKRALMILALTLMSTALAKADECPNFYRFVDFGLAAPDGKLYRGGPTLRAEGFDGQALLLAEATDCSANTDTATDGHGNPIPIVSRIAYDPLFVDEDLQTLGVFATDHLEALATQSSAAHRTGLAAKSAVISRGANYLCASPPQHTGFTCQIVSPFKVNIDLVIACNDQTCAMPLLAATDRLVVTASWQIDDDLQSNPDAAAAYLSQKVQAIHDFLKPLSAAL